jgi:hypothetical protein
MATSNDRIAQVEFNLNLFKTETVKAYGELASELLIVKVLSENTMRQIAELKAHLDRIDIRLDAQDAHLMYLHEHTDKTDKRLDRMETMLSQILARLPENPN